MDKTEKFTLTIGREGTPGARVFKFDGQEVDGRVKPGHGTITQAVLGGNKEVSVAEGDFRATGLGDSVLVLALSGTCTSQPDAPAEQKFTASAGFKSGERGGKVLEGTGSFDCGDQSTDDVPAKLVRG